MTREEQLEEHNFELRMVIHSINEQNCSLKQTIEDLKEKISWYEKELNIFQP